MAAQFVTVARRPAVIGAQVASLHPLVEPGDAQLSVRITGGKAHQHADATHSLPLLRPRRQWPRRRAAEQRDDLTTFPQAEMHPIPHGPERICRIADWSGSVSAQ